jgi:hypothetical protein
MLKSYPVMLLLEHSRKHEQANQLGAACLAMKCGTAVFLLCSCSGLGHYGDLSLLHASFLALMKVASKALMH